MTEKQKRNAARKISLEGLASPDHVLLKIAAALDFSHV